MSVRIVTSNVSDAATITSSDFLGTLPVTNLQLEGRGRVARTANATGTKTINGALSAASLVACCVLYGHNLSTVATWRFRLWDGANQTGTLVYDSGSVVALPAVGWGEFQWGALPWGASVFYGWPNAYSVLWFTAVGALSFRLEITDTANASGYIQAKRLLVGPYFEPQVNFAYGLRLHWQDQSQQRRTQGGSLRTDSLVKYRVLAGDLSYLTNSERPVATEMLRQIALRSETFVSVFPGLGGALERDYSLLGKFTVMPAFTNNNPGSHSAAISFEEV